MRAEESPTPNTQHPRPTVTEVEAALEEIRPAVALEGGEIELVSVEGNVACVRVRMPGAEAESRAMRLLSGIQRSVRAEVPGIRAVVNQDLRDAGYSLEQLAAQMERGDT